MSSMRMPYSDAASALLDRVELVLSEESLKKVYGEGSKIKSPKVTDNLADDRPPFYAWVIPIARTANTTGSATSHEHRMDFELYVCLYATHRDFDVAQSYVDHWVHSVMMGVAADATLGHAVDNAIPNLTAAGCDSTMDKKYLCAAEVTVRCTVYSQCPSIFKELIANAEDQS